MATDSRLPVNNPEERFLDLLTYAELLNTPRLARLYIYILKAGPVDIETIKTELEMAHSTTYKYISQLEEMDIIDRNQEHRPSTVTAEPIRLVIGTDDDGLVASPALIDAIGRQLNIDDIRVFVDRHGVAKLAAALHHAIRIRNGELTQRTAASKLDVQPVEAMTVFSALEDVLNDAATYDPYLAEIISID
jgi:hypothetical protein